MKVLKYTKLDKKIVIKFDNIYSPIQIDGKIITIRNGEEISFDSLPVEIYLIQEEKHSSRYKNIEDEILSVDEYDSKLNSLSSAGIRDEDGILSFTDLDAEYAYKKFKKAWYPEFKISINLIEKIELEEVKVLQISDQFISPLRLVGEDITNPICVLNINHFKLISDIAKKYGFVQIEDSNADRTQGFNWSCPNHSGCEFLKVNSHYVLTGSRLSLFARGTYEECKGKLKIVNDIIDDIFAKEKAILDNIPISNIELQTIFAKLTTIKSFYRKVESIKKTYNEYCKLGDYINELEKSIIEGIKQKNNLT